MRETRWRPAGEGGTWPGTVDVMGVVLPGFASCHTAHHAVRAGLVIASADPSNAGHLRAPACPS